MSSMIEKAYDPEHFRQQGHDLVNMLADYLHTVHQAPDDLKAIHWESPDESLKRWEEDSALPQTENWETIFRPFLDASVHVHHPRYMGHQISPSTPVAALAGFLGDFLNNGMGVYEMGVASTTVERVVIKKIAGQMGMAPEGGGFLTSGGTLGNLTALLCARSVKVNDNIWEKGSGRQLALMVSEQAHYCVDRAVRIMGWGTPGIIKIPANDRFQMRTDLLPDYLEKAEKDGKKVIAVVGSACTTSTGSFDDLEAIGRFCEKNDLWFHVDGAHGAAVVFSSKYKKTVKGIQMADSVVMDFHKMLLTPSITTALVFRREEDSYRTFAQKAQYLWNEEKEKEWFNMAKRTFECTKLMLSLKVYATLRAYGTQLWEEYVTKVMDLGILFGELINGHPSFELATAPQCNIVCFRFVPQKGLSDPELNDLNDRIRQSLLEEGAFYIVKTNLDDKLWLRCTLTNPFTGEEELRSLLERIEKVQA